MTEYILLFIGAVFVHNVILARFLGNCPFLGVSKKIETAIGMGVAVTFVITLASIMTYLSYNIILVNLNLKYLYNIVFILVIASLVQLVEMIIQKTSPALYQALGVYLPLITTNCAVLGVAVINMKEEYDLIKATIFLPALASTPMILAIMAKVFAPPTGHKLIGAPSSTIALAYASQPALPQAPQLAPGSASLTSGISGLTFTAKILEATPKPAPNTKPNPPITDMVTITSFIF